MTRITFGLWLCFSGCVVISIGWSGCSRTASKNTPSAQNGSSDERLSVYVVNYPLKYFAQRIGGEQVEVEFPAPVDIDPAFWKPDAEVVRKYQQADVILLNGANYAKWVKNVTLPESSLMDTSMGFRDQLIEVKDAVTHQHGPQGEHSHSGVAFTTWLDLRLAIEQARVTRIVLVKKSPAHEKLFSDNFRKLENDLLTIDRELEKLLSPHQETPLVASHPVYQYFSRRYRLNLESVHWEPGESPDEKQWAELDGILKKHPAKLMIWEGAPLPETVSELEKRGVKSVVFSPCGNTPQHGDFLTIMKENLANLRSALDSNS